MSSSKKKGCWLILAPIFIILIIISGISSCVGGDDETTTTTISSSTGIESIVFSDTDDVELDVGQKDSGYVKVESNDDLEENDIVFVSSDENVATVKISSTGYSMVYYKIEAVGAGSATIHAESSDGVIKSETITITVNEEPTTQNTITSIEFNSSDDLELAPDETEYDYVRVVYDGAFDIESVVFVSSDENVVTVEKESKRNSLVYFTITAVGEGSATIHAESADGSVKSDVLNVTVSEEEEITTEKETTKRETSVETTKKSTGRTVYRTPSGKRYHYDQDCGGENSYSVSLDAAQNSGLTPCKKCAQ